VRGDPYKVLGLQRGATEEEIRSAYRARARELHPDASGDPDTAAAFRQATEAYDELRGNREERSGGVPVPVRHEAARPHRRRTVIAEPLRRRDPRVEPLRGPTRGGPAGRPRSLLQIWDLQQETLLWLLDEDFFDD
jgi:hypothetical protein